MTVQEMMAWIDHESYEGLLRKWRNAPAGDPFFKAGIADYYLAALRRKRDETPDGGVGASKRIGW